MKSLKLAAIAFAIITVISGAMVLGTSPVVAAPDWCGNYNCANHDQCGIICKSEFTGQMVWLLGPTFCPGQEIHYCHE